MKRFKKFLTEAEATPQQAPATGEPGIKPGMPGTQQYGPPAPEIGETPRNTPDRKPENNPPPEPKKPWPSKYKNFNDFWEAWQRYVFDMLIWMEEINPEHGGTIDWDLEVQRAKEHWERMRRILQPARDGPPMA